MTLILCRYAKEHYITLYIPAPQLHSVQKWGDKNYTIVIIYNNNNGLNLYHYYHLKCYQILVTTIQVILVHPLLD